MSARIWHAGLAVLLSCPAPGQPQPAAEVIQRVVEVEKRLPWFWTPYPEGIRLVPYAYEYKFTNRSLNSKGQEVLPPKLKSGHYKHARSLHLEHIPLKSGWGWTTRCIQQDGLGCQPFKNEFDSPPSKDPEQLRHGRERQRVERTAMWEEFLRAFRFELVEPNHVGFAPTGSYKSRGVRGAAIFEIVSGEFWFDPATFEITKLEFELTADAGNLIAKLYKGTHYTIDLTKAVDNYYLPAKWSVRMNQRLLTNKGAEETEVEYFNYRKFETSSTITFADPEQ